MPDYKEMYLRLFRASEQAINILIAAQRECEDIYSAPPQPVALAALPLFENKNNADED